MTETAWHADESAVEVGRAAQAVLPPDTLPLERLRVIIAAMATTDELRLQLDPPAVVAAGQSLIAGMVACLPDAAPATRASSRAGAGIAERLWRKLTPAAPDPPLLRTLDTAMVLMADHELAASTVAARAAASVRADPYAVVSAGLAVASGTLHAGASLDIEALLAEAGRPERAARAVGERLRRGERIRGFGHFVYKDGDPRADHLLERLRAVAVERPALADRLAVAEAVLDAARRRRLPEPNVDFALEQATGVAAILCSHEHIDHFDAESLPALAAASPEAKVVVPTPLVERVTALGILPDRVVGAQPDEPFELDGVTIHPLPAVHGVDVADAYSFGRELSGGLYRYLGFVVEAEGLRIYHAGDTLADEELQDRLARLAPDVALLPVNGRDHYREAQNIVGNMGPREAVSFAATVGAGLLVPMHYDMFPINLGYPAHLVDFAGRHHQDVAIMLPSRRRPFVC